MSCNGQCKCGKKLASSSLNYELGIMMYRAITTEVKSIDEYDIDANFTSIIDELNEKFIFNENKMFEGFSEESINDTGDIEPAYILYEKALNEYNPNFK